jgi:hypothetical protein
MVIRTLYVPAFDADEAKIIAESVARGETSELAFHSDQAEVERICAHLNRNRAADSERYETFAVPVQERTTHDGRIMVAWAADKVGDIAAVLMIGALIPVVGFASLWERFA